MKKRILYFDLLKIISSFMVVLIHVVSRFWYGLGFKTIDYIILTSLNSIARFCVPIYFMISGALFLNEDKEMSIKTLFKKYIPRILFIYIVWNMLYNTINLYTNNTILNFETISRTFIQTLLGNGTYQFGFLTTLLGFYLCVPVLRLICKRQNKKELKYLLLIMFIFITIKEITYLTVGNLYKFSYIILFSNYIFYFILGYYLNTFEITKKKKNIIYSLGIVALIFTIFATLHRSITIGYHAQEYLDYLSFNICIYSAAVFLLFKNIFNKKTSNKIIYKFAQIYFGIYLIHGLILGILIKLGSLDLNIPITLIVIINTLTTYSISILISFIISKIPIIRKLIYC